MKSVAKIRSFDDAEEVRRENDSRVDKLELAMQKVAETLADAIRSSDRAHAAAEKAIAISAETSKELEKVVKEMKAETKAMQADTRAFKANTEAMIEAMQADTKVMQADTRAFKANTEAMIEEMKADTKAMKADTEELKIAVKKCTKGLGDLGNSRGKLFEHLAGPSINRLIVDELGAQSLGRLESRAGGIDIEIDLWAQSIDKNKVELFVFEVKTTYSKEAIDQVNRHIEKLRKLHREYELVPIYGFIVVGVINPEQEQEVWDAGIQLVRFSDGIFQLSLPPEKFRHKFNHARVDSEGDIRGRALPLPEPQFYYKQLERVRRASGTML